eukprot:11791825-Alexandrium_andersonii.AAC.1
MRLDRGTGHCFWTRRSGKRGKHARFCNDRMKPCRPSATVLRKEKRRPASKSSEQDEQGVQQ